jgi:hypothetical protein
MGEEVIWEIWRRLENLRVADFVQIGMGDCSFGVFERFCWCKNGSRVRCVLNFGTGCSIA